MRITVSHCFVPVADYDEALRFYRDLLGLEERSNVAYEGSRWVTLSPPTQPDVQIVLTDPGSHPNASPADKTAAKELLAKGLLGALIFATDDCDVTFDRLSSAGVDVLQEPIDQAYGVRDCALRDPSGNMVRFSQARRS